MGSGGDAGRGGFESELCEDVEGQMQGPWAFGETVRETLEVIEAGGWKGGWDVERVYSLYPEQTQAVIDNPKREFEWDAELGRLFDEMYMEKGSLPAVAEALMERAGDQGITAEGVARAREMDPEADVDPDWRRAEIVGGIGIDIITDPGYVVQRDAGELRRRYVQNMACLNEEIQERAHVGEMFYVTEGLLAPHERGVNGAAIHAVKKGNVNNARMVWDAPKGFNSDEVVRAGEKIWGRLRHPSALDVIRMINAARRHYGRRAKIVLISTDIKRAFQRMKVNPGYVALTGQKASGGKWLFYLYGFFGWCLFPLIWGVFTRLMVKLCKIRGVLFMVGYCDDFAAATCSERAAQELAIIISIAKMLMGDDAVNVSKTIEGLVETPLLGWMYNTERMMCPPGGTVAVPGTVAMSDVNLRKFAFQVLNLRRDGQVFRHDLESMFSRGSRATMVFPALRPYNSAFANSMRGLERDVLKKVELDVLVAVRMWRVFLVQAILAPALFTRSLASFGDRAPTVKVSFDAYPRGMSVTMQHLDEMGWESFAFHMTVWAFDVTRFQFARDIDPAFQNTVEYLCTVWAGLALTCLGFTDTCFLIEGDSKSGLAWAASGKTRTGRSQRAAVLAATTAVATGNRPHRVTSHVEGEKNYREDLKSRNGDNGKDPKVRLEEAYPTGTLGAPWEDDVLREFMEVVDPETELEPETVQVFHKSAHALVARCEDLGRSRTIPVAAADEFEQMEFFAKGGFSKGTDGSHVRCPPWRLTVQRTATVREVLERFLEKYAGFPPTEIRFECRRLRRIFSWADAGRGVMDVGLESMDMLELFCRGMGGAPGSGSGRDEVAEEEGPVQRCVGCGITQVGAAVQCPECGKKAEWRDGELLSWAVEETKFEEGERPDAEDESGEQEEEVQPAELEDAAGREGENTEGERESAGDGGRGGEVAQKQSSRIRVCEVRGGSDADQGAREFGEFSVYELLHARQELVGRSRSVRDFCEGSGRDVPSGGVAACGGERDEREG